MAITINGIEIESFKGMTESFSKIRVFATAARSREGDLARTETVPKWIQSLDYGSRLVAEGHVLGTSEEPKHDLSSSQHRE